MIRPPHIPARHWYAMSWHARDRATRNYLRALEAERPPRRVEPVIVGPYSRLDASRRDTLPADVRGTLTATIAILARELEDRYEAGLQPHGTQAARERHRNRGEALCDTCAADSRVPVAPFEAAEMARLRGLGLPVATVAYITGRGISTVRDHTRTKEKAA